MNRTRMAITAGALALAAIGATTGMTIAANDDDRPLTGSNLEQASRAALEHTGGGVVVETESGDDGAAYGVEVRLPDGQVVEVQLDKNFKVVGSEGDDDGSGDREGSDDS